MHRKQSNMCGAEFSTERAGSGATLAQGDRHNHGVSNAEKRSKVLEMSQPADGWKKKSETMLIMVSLRYVHLSFPLSLSLSLSLSLRHTHTQPQHNLPGILYPSRRWCLSLEQTGDSKTGLIFPSKLN